MNKDIFNTICYNLTNYRGYIKKSSNTAYNYILIHTILAGPDGSLTSKCSLTINDLLYLLNHCPDELRNKLTTYMEKCNDSG